MLCHSMDPHGTMLVSIAHNKGWAADPGLKDSEIYMPVVVFITYGDANTQTSVNFITHILRTSPIILEDLPV